MPANDSLKIASLVSKVHALKKPIRFWASPDHVDTWNQLMQMGVDYINTDHIAELAAFLHNPKRYAEEKELDNLQLYDGSVNMLPYNRIIHSAGTVIRFGDSSLENHALDVAVIPGSSNVVVEDRYGIFIID